jgi:GLPGLI family protein
MFSRKQSSFLIALICMVFTTVSLTAQKPFKGRIVYNITYAGSNIDLAELQELPGQAVILTKNNQVRTEMTGENASLSQVKISDANTGEVSTMLDILREKYVVSKSRQDIQTALRNMPQPELEFTGQTREILGFTCQRVIARITDDMGVEHQSEIYYTDEIPGDAFNFDSPYNQIPGLMLEYELRVGPLNIRYEAQSVRRRLFVGGRNFYVTRDYERITYDELRQRLQGYF